MLSAVRSHRACIALSFLFLWLCPSAVPAQESSTTPAPPHRARIGLALSGGGARGLAHIGVLEWMEENHVPVDSVAGTSMGALVGAVFATSMNTAEVRAFVKTIQWDNVLLSEPSYDQLSYRRKQDRRNYQVGAMLGLKHGIGGPNGLSPGNGVALTIDRFTFPYSTVSRFDDLPTPFRCVATDMLTGDAVVLKDGSLAESLRATMSIPGVFTPVELNGRVLADGGMVDNIPTDVARSMGADVVIAVDVIGSLSDREKLQNIAGVLDQSISLMTLEHDRRSLQQADIVLAPALGDASVFDYENIDNIIRMGYETAARKSVVLRRFALPDDEWKQYVAERESRKRTAPKSVERLEVTGVRGDEEQHLSRSLRKLLNRNLELPQLEARLTRIVGQGRFDSIAYEGFVQNGEPGLRILAHEKPYGPPFIDLSIDVNGSGVAAFDFAAGARVTFFDVAHGGGEWRNDLLLGSRNLAASEFYQPLGTSRFFVAPYTFASKTPRNAFAGQTRVAVFGDERAGGGFDLGYNTGRRSEVRLGYKIFDGRLAPLVGSSGLPIANGPTGQFRLRYIWDGQDSPGVPSKGSRITLDLTRIMESPGITHPIEQADLQSSTFVPLSAKTSIFLAASGGTTFKSTAGPFQVFALGGPFRLGAYLPQEFLGNHYAYAALGFRRDLYRLPQLVGKKIYWGGWYEAGSAFNDPSSVAVRGTFNLGVIAETIVGPVALAASASPTGQSRANFSIGRLF